MGTNYLKIFINSRLAFFDTFRHNRKNFLKGISMSNPIILMETSSGDVLLELFEDKAPLSVANFLTYVDEGFYQNTIFHRVIKDFMIQGGGYTVRYEEKPTHAPIKNEAANGLKNVRGSLAMARTAEPHSASAQF